MQETKYVDVSDRIVLMRTTGSHASEGNVVCIAMEDRLIFIDAGINAGRTKKFRDEMEKKYELETTMMLLTHTHDDHFYGVDAFCSQAVVVKGLHLDYMRVAARYPK